MKGKTILKSRKLIAVLITLGLIINFFSAINLKIVKASEIITDGKTTISGILICGNCRNDGYIITHSRGCCLMASCAISGYGILVPKKDKTYKFYKFDKEGTDEAYQLLNSFVDLGVSDYLSVNVTGVVNDTPGEYTYVDGANNKTVKYEGSISNLNIEYDSTHESYTKNAVSLSEAGVKIGKVADQVYTGKAIKPKLTVKDGDYTLRATEDYNVTYKANTNLGTATVTITGVGAYYKDTLSTTFNIVQTTDSTTSNTGNTTGNTTTNTSKYLNPTGYQEESTTWSYVTFGSYPQSEITGTALTDAIKNATYDSNGDATIDGIKYHRIGKSDVTDSTDYAWADGEYRYFKYEPIKWRVLKNSDDELLLAADSALDDKKFNDNSGDVTWENSSIRTWLNNNFINSAFSQQEQAIINTSNVVNSVTNSKGINSGSDTQDKVYLLGSSEITNNEYGFASDENYQSHSRLFHGTSYAEAKGAYLEDNGNITYYWLRTSARDHLTAGIGLYNGSITYNYTNQNKVDYGRAGVIPVIKIKKNSNLWSGVAANPTYSPEKLATYSYVELGSYPQSEVNGNDLSDAIINAKYHENGDATVGTEKYRRLNVPTKLTDDKVTDAIKNYTYDSNGYYKENDVIKYRHIVETKGTQTNNYYYQYAYKYYKYEPVKWKVLSNDGTTVKLLADKGLTTKQYYNIEGPQVTWATSTLRPWLNNDFYNSVFTDDEKAVINTTTVQTLDSEANTDIKGGDTTNDKVYLLALQDLRNPAYGFNSDQAINSPSRQIKYTDYSAGVAANNWTGFDVPGEWWLRSPGNYITNPVTVYSNGTVRTTGRYDVYSVGVVPVIEVSLNQLNALKATDISKLATVLDIGDQNYTGSAITPAVTVKNGNTSLVQGVDYTVSYSNNINEGTATVTITGIGTNYKGTIEKTFLIKKTNEQNSTATRTPNTGATSNTGSSGVTTINPIIKAVPNTEVRAASNTSVTNGTKTGDFNNIFGVIEIALGAIFIAATEIIIRKRKKSRV